MSKVKITVLKRCLNTELADEYCNCKVDLCPTFKEGQEFIASFDMPDGFCGSAWNDISKYVMTLISGGNFSKDFFDGWMKDDNQMIACCSDGIRPVVFKIERIEN